MVHIKLFFLSSYPSKLLHEHYEEKMFEVRMTFLYHSLNALPLFEIHSLVSELHSFLLE